MFLLFQKHEEDKGSLGCWPAETLSRQVYTSATAEATVYTYSMSHKPSGKSCSKMYFIFAELLRTYSGLFLERPTPTYHEAVDGQGWTVSQEVGLGVVENSAAGSTPAKRPRDEEVLPGHL